ncbi:MAG: bifunctional riboflavin kinase/FAD synthetase [Lachnospiraceae bacterium]|uniref:Riboflavin biosynthesis protein n=1 Tax=Candidatus Weimeria bifida TaxID=2599074 RepID=A0A6N7IXY7_9FIRM|nr:bifunctional riboflavin kinase/FAD synthetase [Candidatus Weimeria bifida]RRF96029.1 MAG: bifunctional riboflavin kinase/FAD synthetase [Lachnospiraceae bacterium]
MEIIKGIENYLHKFPTAVTVGKFDGIHQGHEALVSLITKQPGLKSVMVTFEKSPKQVLFDPDMKFIVTEEERNAILAKQGIDVLLILPFDDSLMHQSPEDFIGMLYRRLNMCYLAVGSDFTFGYKGAGNASLLSKLSEELGFELNVIEKIREDGAEISSTRIRGLIKDGDVEEAARLLGRPYFIYGPIVHGKHIGTGMGIPTINIVPPDKKLLPPFGVYISTVDIDGRIFHGITNVGDNPTISDDNRVTVETNLLDVTNNLYGEKASVAFYKYVRPEKKFKSIEDLKREIEKNIRQARDYFNRD